MGKRLHFGKGGIGYTRGERGLGFYDEALQGVYQGRELRADVQMVWE